MGKPPVDESHIRAILAKAEEVKNDPRRFTSYADDPIGMARDVLGIRRKPHQPEQFFPNDCGLWTKQQDLLLAVRDHRRVVAKSGHGTGKSFDLGVLIVWWHLSRLARVLSTGPTKTHIEDVLWPELHEVVRNSLVPLPGQLDKLNWRQDSYWYATGFTTDTQGAFQGRHHPRLLGVMDEAAAIPDPYHVEMGTCASGEFNHIVKVGNPTLTSGAFYDNFQNPVDWFPLTISCLDHPNVITGEELIPGAISRKQVEEWRRDWGEEHPFWFSRVLGEFPLISEKGLIPLLWLDRALNEAKRLAALRDAKDRGIQRVAGLDVSRYGKNKCVFTVRRGDAVEHIEAWGHVSTMQTCGKLIHLHRTWGFSDVAIDEPGVGGGVVDRLYEQELPFRVRSHNGGHSAGRSGMYSNRRSELGWHTRSRLERRRLWLPPQHPEVKILRRDMLAPEYGITSAGKLKVETKEDLMGRGVQSPDYLDSLMLCFAVMDDPDSELEQTVAEGQDPNAFTELRRDTPKVSVFSDLPDGF